MTGVRLLQILAFGVQLGVAASEEISPDFAFDRAAARSLVAVNDDAALRFDAATYRFHPSALAETGYDLGVGAALRIPPLGGTLGLAFADDLFTIDLNHSNVTATIGVPVGILLEAVDGFALALRSGYRHGWGGGGFNANWIPLGADVLLNLASRFDFVASAEVPGETGTHGKL